MSLENLKKLLEPELLKEVYELMDAARKDTACEVLKDLEECNFFSRQADRLCIMRTGFKSLEEIRKKHLEEESTKQ